MKGAIIENEEMEVGRRSGGQLFQEELKEAAVEGGQLQQEALARRRFYGPAVTQDLPPDILADQYMLEATEAMENGEWQKAGQAFKKIEALDIEPPPTFAYFYGRLLAEHGAGPEALRKGQSLLKQFVISAGRESEYYTPTLKLLSMVESKVEAAERLEQFPR